MGDHIANQYTITNGTKGAIQYSDGSGLLASSSQLYFNESLNRLYADTYIGDGGLLSNVQSASVTPGLPNQVAVY